MSTQSIVPVSLACPRCRGSDVSRSRTRGFIERLARFLGLRAFRCMTCYERFFSFADTGRQHHRHDPEDAVRSRHEAKVRV